MESEALHIDCMEYMRGIADNAFDLVIADPPYGIGADKPAKKPDFARQSDGRMLPIKNVNYTWKEWDATVPDESFFTELKRISRHQIIFGANYFGLRGGMIVWDKIKGESDQMGCEIAYQSFKMRTDIVYFRWNGMLQGVYCGRDMGKAFAQQGNKALNERRIHPTQKPVPLYAWLLRNYADKGWRIYDPMMGSQSSRIAAYKLGYDYVGCELDKEYYDKGCLRFNEECLNITKTQSGKMVEQLSLFD